MFGIREGVLKVSTKIITEVVCDSCGQEADHKDLELSYQGKGYQMDLCDDCIAKLETAISPLVDSARRVKSNLTVVHRRSSGAASRGVDPKQVRQWAKSRGIKLPKRGRIPASVLDRYQAA